jgi:peptide/nickel transport system permease protein
MDLSYVLQRIFQAALSMAAMSVVVFVAIYSIGNPIEILLSPEATAAERQSLIASLGLDLPLWRQYLLFLNNVLHGQFGSSFAFNQPALPMIAERFGATFELVIAAVLLSVVIGIPLGLYAGCRPKTVLARLIMGVSILGFSLPTFWVGLVMILIFSVNLGWLPAGGRGETADIFGTQWSFLTLDGLRHLALPALNLALFKISLVTRLTRAGVQEVLRSDYITYARARGIAPVRIIGLLVLKNISIPLVTVVGMEFGSTLAFAVVTETIFSWPGMGKLAIDSINLLDRPVIVAYLMMIVLIFNVVNSLVDISYHYLDPRVRRD